MYKNTDSKSLLEKYLCLCADKNNLRYDNYFNIMLNILTSMFKIEGAPFNVHELFTILALNGICGIHKQDDHYILTYGDYYGVPEPWAEFPPDYIGTRPGFQYNGSATEGDIVIAYMLPNRLPDLNIFWFAQQFTEVDKSLYNNLIFSRIAPIAVVGRENERQAYIECVEQMVDGKLINVIQSVTNPVDGLPADMIKTIDITDGKYSEKIQYLSRYHEDLVRRLAMLYGHSMATTSKSANLLQAEVNSTETFSKIYPFMMRDCINEWLAEFNRKFGYTLNVNFGDAWNFLNESEVTEDDKTDSSNDIGNDDTTAKSGNDNNVE